MIETNCTTATSAKLWNATYNVSTLRQPKHMLTLEKKQKHIKCANLNLSGTKLKEKIIRSLKSKPLLYQKNLETDKDLLKVAIMLNKRSKHRVIKVHAISD